MCLGEGACLISLNSCTAESVRGHKGKARSSPQTIFKAVLQGAAVLEQEYRLIDV